MKKRPHTRHRKYTNRNRPWDTRQHTFALTMKGAVVIILFVLVGVAWLVIRHANESLADGIAREEARQRSLMEELQRETARWNAKRSPENLRTVLLANGIAMNVPTSRQRVAMRGPGVRPAGAAGATGTAYAANRR